MWRRDVSAADVIPIFVVALKNPFAETAFAAAVFVTRLVTAAPPLARRSLFLAPLCLSDEEGEERASRVEWISSRDLGGMRETNRIKTTTATWAPLTHSLSPSVTHVTRVGCERRQKNLINAHHIVLITRARPMIQCLGWHYFVLISRLTDSPRWEYEWKRPSTHIKITR